VTLKLGILHPGAMGISVAATACNSGYPVWWASSERSLATRKRAVEHDLRDAETVSNLCQLCDVILSVCPPHAAEEMAELVIGAGFEGTYLDANAISPQRSLRIAAKIEEAGGSYIDGGIIGGPAWQPGQTWLYLSGPRADQAVAFFAAGPMETAVVSDTVGDASALKVCFAAYTKGSTALLCAIVALAEELGVRQPLFEQWSRGGSDFADQTTRRVRGVTTKAWRFAGEMEEIAATFAAAGLPDGFHLAAHEVYRQLAPFKDEPELPSLAAVLAALGGSETIDE
jgi:3-hydroxyisobutyrate dehydrogenase-like beta-hydroxyacid dehydrogenase